MHTIPVTFDFPPVGGMGEAPVNDDPQLISLYDRRQGRLSRLFGYGLRDLKLKLAKMNPHNSVRESN